MPMHMYDSAEQYAKENIENYIDILRTTSYSAPTNAVTSHLGMIITALETVRNIMDGNDLEQFERLRQEVLFHINKVLVLKLGNSIGMHEMNSHLIRLKSGDFIGLLIWAKSGKMLTEKIVSNIH